MRIKPLRIAEWRGYHPRDLPVGEEGEFLTLNGSAECHRAYPTTANNTIPRTMVLPRAVTSRAALAARAARWGQTDCWVGEMRARPFDRTPVARLPSLPRGCGRKCKKDPPYPK